MDSISQKILEKEVIEEVIEGDDLKDLLASSVMPEDAQAIACAPRG